MYNARGSVVYTNWKWNTIYKKNKQTFGGFHFSVHDSGVIFDTSSGPSGAPGLSRMMTRMLAVSDPLLFLSVTE